MAAIAEAQAALRSWLADASAPMVFNAELVAEEVLGNVVRHAGLASDSRIGFVAERLDGGIRLTIEDPGPPFDPRTVAAKPAPASLAEAVPGGLGLLLVRRMAAAMAYERTAAGLNRFSVTLAPPPGG